jgi:GNAT superfamily N-acetyltransferase
MSEQPSPSQSDYRAERARSEHADELLALFESAGSGCYCSYWYFQGDKNAWLERCYLKPEENRSALVARLGADELCGVVARPAGGGPICGWLNVSRAARLTRLYDQRIYKGLPCFDSSRPGQPAREAVYAVACCYVAEEQRGRGVGRVLLHQAIAEARRAGGTALEAFPRGASVGGAVAGERLRPDLLQMGPEALFLGAGFVAVSDFGPYPVLRLTL